MGRVLIIVDNQEMSANVLRLALNGIKEGREHLYVGLLINQLENSAVKQSESVLSSKPIFPESDEKTIFLGNSFQNAFLNEGIATKVCFGECLNTKEIVKETAFADLLIIDSNTFVDYLLEKDRFQYLRGVFEKSQCPLLVIPTNFRDFHDIIILKDPEEKVVKAVKSLKSTLTQSLRNAEVSLIGKMPNEEEEFQDEKRLIDFLKRYFRNVGIMLTPDEPFEKVAFDLMQKSQMPLVVMAGIDKNRIDKLILPLITKQSKQDISFYIENPF